MADILLVGARRTWPLLGLVPSSWLRPLLMPSARRVRHSLIRPVLIVALAASTGVALLTVLP